MLDDVEVDRTESLCEVSTTVLGRKDALPPTLESSEQMSTVRAVVMNCPGQPSELA